MTVNPTAQAAYAHAQDVRATRNRDANERSDARADEAREARSASDAAADARRAERKVDLRA
jgi:hypothetical protein